MEFVEQKRKEILTGGAATANAYTSRLRTLNGGVTPTDYDFLEDMNHIMSFLEKNYKPNTQRNFIIAIVSTLKKIPGKKHLYEQYSEIMNKFNSELRVNNTRSEVQQENWISQAQVIDVYHTLYRKTYPTLFKKGTLDASEWDSCLHFMVLALYTQIAPRRILDFILMVVVKRLPKQMNLDINYLDLESKSFYFNNYKTSGTYNTQTVRIPDDLFGIIQQYLKKHPLKLVSGSSIPLLCDFKGQALPRPNIITRILNKIFDKQISVSLLRNIYLTDKFKHQNSEMEMVAENMGTSVGTIQSNYIKKDV